MSPEQLRELMESRRSVREFRSEPVPRELIEDLLQAAISAPSASNKQPWRFLVVTSKQRREAMAKVVREAVERVAEHVSEDFAGAFRSYGNYFVRFEDAPVVVVVLHRRMSLLSGMVEAGLSDEDQAAITIMEENSGLVSSSLALQNLLLMAHAVGLGASGMTGPLLAYAGLKSLLSVSKSWDIAALVPLGYPAETPTPKARKSLKAVTRWLD